MSGKQLRKYCFKHESQWKTCLFSHTDGDALRSNLGVRPFPPYAGEPDRYESPGASAPVVLRTGQILWHDSQGWLHWASADYTTSEVFCAPPSIAVASRVVSIAGGLWVKSAKSESLESYDDETLARLLTIDLESARIVDIAGGDRDTILVLIERGNELKCIRFSCSGHEIGTISFSGISRARAFIFLRRSQQFVVLAGDDQPRLYWFAAAGGQALRSKPLAAIQACFKADVLGSDYVDKVILAGSTSDQAGTHFSALILDTDGNRLSEVRLEKKATGITATRQNLIVADERGLLRYATADTVPDTTAEVRCTLITPLLQSLNVEGGFPWLRVDVSTTLPEGTTLEISYVATDEPEVRDRQKVIADDVRLPPIQRIQQLLGEPGWSPKTLFHGSDRDPDVPEAPRSAPLFDARGRYLWLCITLTAVRGARLPAVTELAVLYPGRSLVENLPMPYRRAAEQPGDFLRLLVGVLEATTQELDTRIAALGSHIHPATASGPWMDYIAGWLGLPWSNALADDQKRAILRSAAGLAKKRGTRGGLEALLECLLPGSPRRFRVTDATADFGYAVVGGERCAGSALPAMLGGFTRWHAELDSTAVLGRTRLPCPGSNSSAQRPARTIRVEVAAGYKERADLEPWLLTLIAEMVPLTVSVDLRWVSAHALRTDQLDDTLELEAPPSPHLGTDAITGLARLPEQRRTRLTGSEPAIGTPLR